MNITETTLPGVLIIEPRVFGDDRGTFMETYNAARFREHGLPDTFVQDNHSRSVRGVLRGLHFQLPNPQGKLIWVVQGTIFDVAVDIRRSSPHFGQWVGVELSQENGRQLWVPEGFAHGFCVTSEFADVLYKCTALYDGPNDRGIRWNDPQIAIDWPLTNPLLSQKDAEAPTLAEAEPLPDWKVEG